MRESHCRTFRYMEDFHCIGGDCEATCCAGWRVSLEKQSYYRIQRLLRKSGRDPDAVLEKAPDASDTVYGHFKFKTDGTCSFLDDAGWCELHATYGEAALPNVCTVFPRLTYITGTTVDVAATPACPEVARLCLLSPDATDLVSLPLSVIPRGIGTMLELNPDLPYHALYHTVRNTFLDVLGHREIPIASRLFILAWATGQAPGFDRQCDRRTAATMQRLCERLRDHDTIESVDQGFRSLELSPEVPIAVVHSLLEKHLPKSMGRELNRCIADARSSYCGDRTATLEALALGYIGRRSAAGTFDKEIDQYFTNYARNFWMAEPYVNSQSLREHCIRLLARTAIIRFLFFGAPGLDAICDRAHDDAQRGHARDELEHHLVNVVMRFSRSVQHSASFLQTFRDVGQKQQLDSPAHLALFCGF